MFRPSALAWMGSYLVNRSQKVFFNGSYSDSMAVECGVPQGSCQGPLLYFIFTNDLPLVLKDAKSIMFADDTTVYASATTCADRTAILNSELDFIEKWILENKLILNTSKTKSIVFGSNYSLRSEPELKLFINNTPIQQVKETKLLGITPDNRLSWSKHIDTIVKRMGKTLAVLRRCKTYLTPHLTKLVLNTLVLSHLDYSQVTWANATKKDLSKLQLIQN